MPSSTHLNRAALDEGDRDVEAYVTAWEPSQFNGRLSNVTASAELYSVGGSNGESTLNHIVYFTRQGALEFARALHDAAIANDEQRIRNGESI